VNVLWSFANCDTSTYREIHRIEIEVQRTSSRHRSTKTGQSKGESIIGREIIDFDCADLELTFSRKYMSHTSNGNVSIIGPGEVS